MRLIKKDFEAWLKKQKPLRRFRPGDSLKCPLAAYLRPKAVVWYSTYSIEGRSYATPLWAKRFISSVDNSGLTITARDALKILKGGALPQ